MCSVSCVTVLSNSSTNPAQLLRHLETTHPECNFNKTSFFKQKLETLTNCQKMMIKPAKTDNINATSAS
jgi:hypothetical protein